MADLITQLIPCAYAGLDNESAPDAVREGCSPVVENFLVHYERQMRMRGPLAAHSNLSLPNDCIVAGIWTFGNRALISFATHDATATREPWTAPYRSATAAQLAEPELAMTYIDFDAMTTSTVTAADKNGVIGGVSDRIGDYSLGFAYSNTTDFDTGYGFRHKRKMLKWDGTTTPPTVLTDGIESGQSIKVHYDRLWVLGGIDIPGASSDQEDNTLFYTDAGGPIDSDANSWRAASGVTNKIVVDANNPNDFGVALAKAGQQLAIVKRRSLHMLAGYSDDTFNLKSFSNDIGCVDARTVVEHEDGFYFLSEEGYMYCDGYQLVNVSENVQSELITAVHQTVGRRGYDGGSAFATKLPNHYILLTVTGQTFATGVVAGPTVSYLFHAPTRRWSHFSSNSTRNTEPVSAGATGETQFIIDGKYAIRADYVTLPDALDGTERGFDSVNSVEERIPARYKSMLLKLATPEYMAQGHRIDIDYTFQTATGNDGDENGWTVSAQRGDGTSFQDAYQLPAQGNPGAYLYRRRNVQDSYGEVADIQVTVEWPDGDALALEDALLYDSYFIFQRTRQRRST